MLATETQSGVLAEPDQDIYGNCLLGLTAAEYKTREVLPDWSHSAATNIQSP